MPIPTPMPRIGPIIHKIELPTAGPVIDKHNTWKVNIVNPAIYRLSDKLILSDSAAVEKEQQRRRRLLTGFSTNPYNAKTVTESEQDSISTVTEAANDTVESARQRRAEPY